MNYFCCKHFINIYYFYLFLFLLHHIIKCIYIVLLSCYKYKISIDHFNCVIFSLLIIFFLYVKFEYKTLLKTYQCLIYLYFLSLLYFLENNT